MNRHNRACTGSGRAFRDIQFEKGAAAILDGSIAGGHSRAGGMETVRRARGLVETMKRKIEGKVGNDNGAGAQYRLADGLERRSGLQEDGQVGGNDREEPATRET